MLLQAVSQYYMVKITYMLLQAVRQYYMVKMTYVLLQAVSQYYMVKITYMLLQAVSQYYMVKMSIRSERVCKRPWNFERVPNKMLQGHDKALIFTSTKEACLAACLNEVYGHTGDLKRV
jgi:hypothetical protein